MNREQMQASGKVSIGDFLQSLPEQGGATNTAVNNGGDGEHAASASAASALAAHPGAGRTAAAWWRAARAPTPRST